MCPYFDENEGKCSLYDDDTWSSQVMTLGYDFITGDYCFASEYSSDSGEENTGFANCGMYKLEKNV